MNKIIKAAPFIRLLLPLALGIYWGGMTWSFSLPNYFMTLSIGCFVLLYTCISAPFSQFPSHYFFAAIVYLLLIATGFQLAVWNCKDTNKTTLLANVSQRQLIRMRITSSCVEKSKSIKSVATVEMIRNNGGWCQTQGEVLCYFRNSSHTAQLNYGDRLIVCGKLIRIPEVSNPGMFDYKSYLFYHHIALQCVIDTSAWSKVSSGNGNAFRLLCMHWRERLLQIFKDNRIGGQEFAVAGALLLGYEDKLDKETLSSYSDAGVMHVLSVSGMHVAIIYLVVNMLLTFLEKWKWGRIVKAGLLLLFLWLYAMITGLSPAVMRATWMLSFVVVANGIKRKTNSFNLLAASAFVLLCGDPLLLFDTGFQLSYVAVAGIILVYPLLYKQVPGRSWLLDQLISLIGVSVAAQLVTLPLTLYYFHQFPNYFLLTNLILIPLSSLVIYTGMGLLVLAKIPYVAGVCSWLFVHSLSILNTSIRFASSLPGASCKGIYLTRGEVVLLSGIVITSCLFLARPRILNLYLALTTGIVLSFFLCLDGKQSRNQQQVTIYQVPGATAIDLISGRQHALLEDSCLSNHPGLYSPYMQPSWDRCTLSKPFILPVKHGNRQFVFGKARFLIVDGPLECSSQPLKTDYLILSHGAALNLQDLEQHIRFHWLILDSSCKGKDIQRMKKIARELDRDVWVVIEQGAFTRDL